MLRFPSEKVRAIRAEGRALCLRDTKLAVDEYQRLLDEAHKKREAAIAEAHLAFKTNLEQGKLHACNNGMVRSALEACYSGDLGPIEELYDKGNSETWEFFCNSSPLMLAVDSEQPKVLEYLLKIGLDYTSKDDSGYPAYDHILRLRTSSEAAKEMQQIMSARLLKDVSVASKTAALEWLLDAFAIKPTLINTPIPDLNGITPVMQLAIDGRLNALIWIDQNKYIKNKKVQIDFNKKDGLGRTMFDFAVMWGHKELLEWVMSKAGTKLSELEEACKSGDVPKLDALLSALPADSDVELGHSLIFAVIYVFHSIVVNIVTSLEKVVDEDAAVFMIATQQQDARMMQVLIDAGADITAQNGLALSIAIDGANEDVIEFLLIQDSMRAFAKSNVDRFEAELNNAGFKKSLGQYFRQQYTPSTTNTLVGFGVFKDKNDKVLAQPAIKHTMFDGLRRGFLLQ